MPIAWPTMVIMVTADPLLPKLESPPAPPHAEAPPRRARTTLDPPSCPPLCLSFSLPFLRAGGAASFWVYLEAVAVGYGFPTGRGVFAHPPPPFFRPCAVGGWLPRFFDSLPLCLSLSLLLGGANGPFFGFPPGRWRSNASSHRYRRKKEKSLPF